MSSQPVRARSEPRPQPTPRAVPRCAILLPNLELRVPANIFTLAGFRAWATSEPRG